MILIVLLIVIFAGVAVFLLTFASTIKQTEYTRLYATNLLLSVMRTDTDYMDSKCKQISDVVTCAFFESDWKCGGDGPTCLNLANNTIKDSIDRFQLIQKSYRYLFIVKPVRFDPTSGNYMDVINPRTNEPLRIKVGDLSLESERTGKIVESYEIQKSSPQGPIRLRSQIILSQKPA
jgi:hypothetical protein